MALGVTVTPNTEELYVLERRYADTFDYLYEDQYYSHSLGEAITYQEGRGDNYQSILYERAIIAACVQCLPHGVDPTEVYVEEVITDYLALTSHDYMEVVKPQVHLYLGPLPENSTVDEFPTPCQLHFTR